MNNTIIAIDGPAGAGKSTIAKCIAERMSVIYVDTGAMYRAVALFAIRNNIDFKNDKDKLIAVLEDLEISIRHTSDGQHVFIGSEDVSDKIRTEEVGMGASAVAVIPEVRVRLVELQRKLGEKSSVIMDGRDIGTHVFVNADAKIFLTASAQKRAERRVEQLRENGRNAEYNEVLADIISRDKNDSEREFAPLRKADDAVLIDTTDLTLCEAIDTVEAAIKEVLA